METTKPFVQKLLSTDIVYSNGIKYESSSRFKNNKKIKFNIAGHFYKRYKNLKFYFYPSSLKQVGTNLMAMQIVMHLYDCFLYFRLA